jgi:hypothetical protein
MNMYDEGPEYEPFGPEYVRPANPACPGCGCCTAALCAKGRASVSECAGHVADPELLERVSDCPCSAESTPGTLSWRAAMVRATTFATEKPLRPELESLMTRLSEAAPYADLAGLLPKLAVRRYIVWRPGLEPHLTEFGWAYIRARWGAPRVTSSVTIRALDLTARTAEVIATAFSATQPVTVPLDQVVNTRTGLTAENAVLAVLYADVNADALRAEQVVLTKVYNPLAVVDARPGSPDGAR